MPRDNHRNPGRGAHSAQDGPDRKGPRTADPHLVHKMRGEHPDKAPPNSLAWLDDMNKRFLGNRHAFRDPSVHEQIFATLARYGCLSQAASIAGIGRGTLGRWMSIGRRQCENMAAAEGRGEEYTEKTTHVQFYVRAMRALAWWRAGAQDVIQDAALEDPQWAAWLLRNVGGVGRDEGQDLDISVTGPGDAAVRIKARLDAIKARHAMSDVPDLDEPGT